MRGGRAVVPVIAASRYGYVGLLINVSVLAVELGGGSLIGVEDRVTGEWDEVN